MDKGELYRTIIAAAALSIGAAQLMLRLNWVRAARAVDRRVTPYADATRAWSITCFLTALAIANAQVYGLREGIPIHYPTHLFALAVVAMGWATFRTYRSVQQWARDIERSERDEPA